MKICLRKLFLLLLTLLPIAAVSFAAKTALAREPGAIKHGDQTRSSGPISYKTGRVLDDKSKK